MEIMNTETKKKERIVLKPGSLFILDWRTNLNHKHSIVKIKNIKSKTRLGLTMRAIKTYYSKEKRKVIK